MRRNISANTPISLVFPSYNVQRGLRGLLEILNDNLSKVDQSIWKGMLWQMYINVVLCPERIQFSKLKSNSQNWVLVLIPLNATAPPLKSHSVQIHRAEWYNQAEPELQGGYIHFFTTEGNTTPGRKKTPKQLTLWV